MTRDESIKLTVKSLLEVVQTGAKNIEISVMEGYSKVTVRQVIVYYSWFGSCILLKNMELAEIEAIVSEIEREKEAGQLSIVIFTPLILNDCSLRGRTQEVAVGSDGCWPSCDDTESICRREFWPVDLTFNTKMLCRLLIPKSGPSISRPDLAMGKRVLLMTPSSIRPKDGRNSCIKNVIYSEILSVMFVMRKNSRWASPMRYIGARDSDVLGSNLGLRISSPVHTNIGMSAKGSIEAELMRNFQELKRIIKGISGKSDISQEAGLILYALSCRF